jgi:hypothetical protein
MVEVTHRTTAPIKIPVWWLSSLQGVLGEVQADELAKATEEVVALKEQLTSEKEANTAQVEELQASARAAAKTAEAKQRDLNDDVLSLQEQVCC